MKKVKKSCLTCGKMECYAKSPDGFMDRALRLTLGMALIPCRGFVPMEGVNYADD